MTGRCNGRDPKWDILGPGPCLSASRAERVPLGFEVARNLPISIFAPAMATVSQRRSKAVSAEDRSAAWLARARKMPPAERVVAVERRLLSLPKTPTAANVFFRKQLLRLRDESRVKAGMVDARQLQLENSPFAGMDFRTARINFRRRVRA